MMCELILISALIIVSLGYCYYLLFRRWMRYDLYPSDCWRYLGEDFSIDLTTGQLRLISYNQLSNYSILTKDDFQKCSIKTKTCLVAEEVLPNIYHLVIYARGYFTDPVYNPRQKSSYFPYDCLFGVKEQLLRDLIIDIQTQQHVSTRSIITKVDPKWKVRSTVVRKSKWQKRNVFSGVLTKLLGGTIYHTNTAIHSDIWTRKETTEYVEFSPPTTGYCVANVIKMLYYLVDEPFSNDIELMDILTTDACKYANLYSSRVRAEQLGLKRFVSVFDMLKTLAKFVPDYSLNDQTRFIVISTSALSRYGHVSLRIYKESQKTSSVLSTETRLVRNCRNTILGGYKTPSDEIIGELSTLTVPVSTTNFTFPKKSEKSNLTLRAILPLYKKHFSDDISMSIIDKKYTYLSTALNRTHCTPISLFLSGASTFNPLFHHFDVYVYAGLMLYTSLPVGRSTENLADLEIYTQLVEKKIKEIIPNIKDGLTIADIEELIVDYRLKISSFELDRDGTDFHLYYKNLSLGKPVDKLCFEIDSYLSDFIREYPLLEEKLNRFCILGTMLLLQFDIPQSILFNLALCGVDVSIYSPDISILLDSSNKLKDPLTRAALRPLYTTGSTSTKHVNINIQGEWAIYVQAFTILEKPKKLTVSEEIKKETTTILKQDIAWSNPKVKSDPRVNVYKVLDIKLEEDIDVNMERTLSIENRPAELTLSNVDITATPAESIPEVNLIIWLFSLIFSNVKEQYYWVPRESGRYHLNDGGSIYRTSSSLIRRHANFKQETLEEGPLPYLHSQYRSGGFCYRLEDLTALGNGVFSIKISRSVLGFSRKPVVLSSLVDPLLYELPEYTPYILVDNVYSESVRAAVDLWLNMGDNIEKFKSQSIIQCLTYVNARLSLLIELTPVWTNLVYSRYVMAKTELGRISMYQSVSKDGRLLREYYVNRDYDGTLIYNIVLNFAEYFPIRVFLQLINLFLHLYPFYLYNNFGALNITITLMTWVYTCKLIHKKCRLSPMMYIRFLLCIICFDKWTFMLLFKLFDSCNPLPIICQSLIAMINILFKLIRSIYGSVSRYFFKKNKVYGRRVPLSRKKRTDVLNAQAKDCPTLTADRDLSISQARAQYPLVLEEPEIPVIPLLEEYAYLGPRIHNHDSLSALWALLMRQSAPIVLPDPNIKPRFKTEEYIKEMVTLIDSTDLSSFAEYLTDVESCKRESYKRGLNDFKTKGKLDLKFYPMPKKNETQYVTAIEKHKPRNIMNPSESVKAVGGWIVSNLLRLSKKTKLLGPHIVQGQTPDEIKDAILLGYKTVENPVCVSWDGGRHDAHQHSSFIDSVDNYIYRSLMNSLCSKLGFNLMETLNIIESMTLNVNTVDFCLDRKVTGFKNVGKSGNISILKGKLNGSVFSGHPGRTTYGNTIRILELIRVVTQDAGLRWKYDVYPLQAGDDTLVILNAKYVSIFEASLMKYYSRNDSEVHTHGYGQLMTDFKTSPNNFEFLSKIGYVDKNVCHLFRIPLRVLTAGLYNKTGVLTDSQLNSAVCQSLEVEFENYPGMSSFIESRRRLYSNCERSKLSIEDLNQLIDRENKYKYNSCEKGSVNDIRLALEKAKIDGYTLIESANHHNGLLLNVTNLKPIQSIPELCELLAIQG
jgi:hypothetical protein